MKLFKSTIMAFAALAALTITGCSEEKITYGEVSDGLYFSSDTYSVNVTEQTNAFNVEVYRQGLTAASSYTIVATGADASLFTIPTTVVFTEGSNVAVVPVTCDVTKLSPNEKYNFNLTFGDGVPECKYGSATIDVTVALSKNYSEAKPFADGIYTWDLSAFLVGQMVGYIDYRYNLDDPTDGQFLLYYFIYREDDDPLPINYNTETNVVSIPLDSETGFDYNGNMVYVTDMYTFQSVYNPGKEDAYAGTSRFNPETGLFTLNLLYYFYQGNNIMGADGYEYCQVDGFGDYSIKLSYAGQFVNSSATAAYATVDYTIGSDATKAVLLASTSNNVDDIVNAIEAGDPGCTVIEPSKQGTEGTAQVQLDGEGTYTVVGVTYDGDQMMSQTSFTFSTSAGVPENESYHWTEVGTATIADAWILPKYLGTSSINTSRWTVTLKESNSTPGLYRIKNPWTSEACPIFEENTNAVPTDIFIDATNPDFVVIKSQYSGFTDADGAEYYIANFAGSALADTIPTEEIISGQYARFNTKLEDGILVIQPAVYGYSIDAVDQTQARTPQATIRLNIEKSTATTQNAKYNVKLEGFNRINVSANDRIQQRNRK